MPQTSPISWLLILILITMLLTMIKGNLPSYEKTPKNTTKLANLQFLNKW